MVRRDIEIFLTVAEELHFSRAAARLHVTPARVTQTIKLMERRFGAALFERTSRRVALTPIGQRLYDDLRPAHDQLLAGIERAMLAGREVHGTLRVGFVGAAAGQPPRPSGRPRPRTALLAYSAVPRVPVGRSRGRTPRTRSEAAGAKLDAKPNEPAWN
jgi:DNA-binding transcriptional LysR family regulator